VRQKRETVLPCIGKVWITDDHEEKTIYKNESLPIGWHFGRHFNSKDNKSEYARQQSSIRIKLVNPAKGYKRTEKEKKAISERMKGNQNWKFAKPSLGMLRQKAFRKNKRKDEK